MKPHLIMPMGGAGSRFSKNGYILPKPLIEINGKPFLYWATQSIVKFVDVADITFVVLRQHVEAFQIDQVIKEYYPYARIIILEKILEGPVFTSLMGVQDIEDDAPVLFNDCDHMFRCDEINQILNRGFLEEDGALLTFESSEPQFSYVKYDNDCNIVGTVEKKVVSVRAICGAYIFKNATVFKKCSEEYVKKCPYNECFMSGVYNVMCEQGLKVKDYLLDYHVEFGTPEEYEKAKASKFFADID